VEPEPNGSNFLKPTPKITRKLGLAYESGADFGTYLFGSGSTNTPFF
jgi:hypothetical protein